MIDPLNWRAVGRVQGGDDIEAEDFTLERSGDRWLLCSDGRLVAVGDSSRDLVATKGGLQRHPAGHGFKPYLSASIIRRDGAPIRTGTYVEADGASIVIDELTTATPASEFVLLDLIPEIDLSQRSEPDAGLHTIVAAVTEASGLTVEAMWGDVDDFRLIVLNGVPQALITRQHSTEFEPAVFGGIQDRQSDGEWTRHVDTASDDPLWVRGIVKALDASLG